MKVKILETGKSTEVNDSFGTRLIEQGKAVLIPKEASQRKKSKKVENGTE